MAQTTSLSTLRTAPCRILFRVPFSDSPPMVRRALSAQFLVRASVRHSIARGISMYRTTSPRLSTSLLPTAPGAYSLAHLHSVLTQPPSDWLLIASAICSYQRQLVLVTAEF